MPDLKCKMCGGALQKRADGNYQCESCGTVFRVMSAAQKQAEMIRRALAAAQKMRENGDFGQAYVIYENILARDNKNVEARWNLLLCRYGILYTFDELTGEDLPTVNRMRYDSILNDPDYARLLEDAPAGQREEYIRKVNLISTIQQRYLAIAQAEQPYDVFISFKAEDGRGGRSRDSVIAQEIYNQLTEKKLRVFYSRISLEGKGGEAYEPYIFSALNTAKVMILVGTRPDYVTSTWVANEWQRFLTISQEKKDRSLIPVYEGMAREDFPPEIPVREAVDYSAQGALFQLTQGVLSITGKGVLVEAENSAGAVYKMTEGMRAAIADEDWENARSLANDLLDIDAENGDAYLNLLLAQYKVKKVMQLANIDDPWTESRYYQRAAKYCDDTTKALLEAVAGKQTMRIQAARENRSQEAEHQRKELELSNVIAQARQLMEKHQYEEAQDLLAQKGYSHPDAAQMIAQCQKSLDLLRLTSNPDLFEEDIRTNHPVEYAKIVAKAEGFAKRTKGESDVEDILSMVIGVALVVIPFLGSPDGFIPGPAALIAASVICYFAFSESRLFALGVPAVSCFLYFIMSFGSDPDMKYIGFGLFMLLGAGRFILGAFSLVASILYKKAYREYAALEKAVLLPLQDECWQRIVRDFSPYVDPALLKKRPTGFDEILRKQYGIGALLSKKEKRALEG